MFVNFKPNAVGYEWNILIQFTSFSSAYFTKLWFCTFNLSSLSLGIVSWFQPEGCICSAKKNKKIKMKEKKWICFSWKQIFLIKKCIAMKIHRCAHYWKHAGMVKSSNTYSSLVAGDGLGINAVTIFSPRSLFAQFLLCSEWQFSTRCFQITRENVQAIAHPYPSLCLIINMKLPPPHLPCAFW